jgi:ubiquinone biosynthesis protein
MRRFIVEVLIDVVLLIVISWVLSLIAVAQPFPFGEASARIVTFVAAPWQYVAFAAVFTIVNRVARPVVLALTGRLVLSTAGLFFVIVNLILLWITSLVTPDVARIADPVLLWMLLFAVLFTVASLVVDVVLGLSRPAFDASGEGQGVWRLLDALPTPRRNAILENVRFQQVYSTIYRYGLDIALEGTPVDKVRGWFQRRILGEAAPEERATAPARVRMMLQQLGPTYVKIGQMAASRGEALPPEWLSELQMLQSEVAPFPWTEARETIVRELGKPPEELFASIEEEPFAAASTAQVHRATLPDGTLVAVKIQRPQIVAKTKADLGVLQELARIAEGRFEVARRLGARGIVREFANGVIKELDYRNEAYHAKRLADGMAKFPDVHIPEVYDDRSSARVLTMEFVTGIKISKIDELDAADVDRQAVGTTFVRALIKQVLVDGFFHGDPHPGNVLVDPATKRIVFLDLGLVGQLSSEQRVGLLKLIYAVRAIEIQSIADAILAIGEPQPGFDEAAFRSDVDRVSRQYLMYGASGSLADALSAILGAVYDNGLQLSNDLTIALKAVIQAEETARALSPKIDIGTAAIDEARSAAFEALDPERLRKTVMSQVVRVGGELLQRAPTLEKAAWAWMDQFGRGQLVVKVDTSDLGPQIERINGLGRQIAIGMLVAGQLIGTAILAVVLLQPAASAFIGLAYFAIIAFGVVLLVSLYVLYRTIRGSRPEEL